MEELYLVHINKIGVNLDSEYEYELYFSTNTKKYDTNEINYNPCGLYKTKYSNYLDFSLIKTINTNIKLSLIQDNMCFGYKHAVDGIMALGFEDINDYDEYPENGRLVLKYGENIKQIEKKLKDKDIYMKE